MRHALIILLATVTLVGCSAKITVPTPSTPPVVTTPPPATVSEQDKADSKDVVVQYFNAVVNNDTATVEYLWYTNKATAAPTPSGTKKADIQKLTLDHIGVEQGALKAFYTVAVDLGPDPGGAWGPGVNTRWPILEKQSGGWKINAMGTSSHQYAK
jgi:uncharacterized protein YcfL